MSKKALPKAKTKRAMPKFTKAPQALVEQFTTAIDGMPDLQLRKMFGYPAAFTKSTAQMFACLFGDDMILRLSQSDRVALHAEGWKPFEPMPGRPMREYLAVPSDVRSSPAPLKRWLAMAHAYAASLPAKAKK
jgi:TfoX/Sxy family transcriptional regulator of competence genes